MTSREEQLQAECKRLQEALEAAPMPYPESTLQGEEWEEAYDQWWHEHASEDALNKLTSEARALEDNDSQLKLC